VSDDDSVNLSEEFPILNRVDVPLFAKIAVRAEIEDRNDDEMLIMHLNQMVGRYDSNIVTFDTSNSRDYWRILPPGGQVSTSRGFAIGYVGFKKRASVIADITVAIAEFKPRVATGTSYTDHDVIDFQQHNQRYLSQIGGICRIGNGAITSVTFSTLHGTPFSVECRGFTI